LTSAAPTLAFNEIPRSLGFVQSWCRERESNSHGIATAGF
jgi:hypothetical protein